MGRAAGLKAVGWCAVEQQQRLFVETFLMQRSPTRGATGRHHCRNHAGRSCVRPFGLVLHCCRGIDSR